MGGEPTRPERPVHERHEGAPAADLAEFDEPRVEGSEPIIEVKEPIPGSDEERIKTEIEKAVKPIDEALAKVGDNPALALAVEAMRSSRESTVEATKASLETFFEARDELLGEISKKVAQRAVEGSGSYMVFDSSMLKQMVQGSNETAQVGDKVVPINSVTELDQLAAIQRVLDSLGVHYDVNSLFMGAAEPFDDDEREFHKRYSSRVSPMDRATGYKLPGDSVASTYGIAPVSDVDSTELIQNTHHIVRWWEPQELKSDLGFTVHIKRSGPDGRSLGKVYVGSTPDSSSPILGDRAITPDEADQHLRDLEFEITIM